VIADGPVYGSLFRLAENIIPVFMGSSPGRDWR